MNSETALYEQLYNCIIFGIATGQVCPGEKMPTVRQLGIELGINLHTVNKAYALLKQNGYLSAHRNKGAVVNDKDSYPADKNFSDNVRERLLPIVVECFARGMKEDKISAIVSELVIGIKTGTEGQD
jgi:GntR family transcriptional regulator